MEYLEIVDELGKRKHIKLERTRYLIGREASCDICLPHPNVSRRHAQLQRSDKGGWLLQDLNSLNHVYHGETPVQQVILEAGHQVRISHYRLTLHSASTRLEPDALIPADDSSPSWPGLEPGWLEQLQQFQRSLLRLDEAGAVLGHLAEQFARIARPQSVAVGLALPTGYAWQIITGAQQNGFNDSLQIARDHADGSDSEIQIWCEGYDNEETPHPASPYCILFPMKGRAGVIGHVYLHCPRLQPMPPPLQRYLSLYANYAGLLWENLQVMALRNSQRQIEAELHQARQIQIELFPPTFEVDPRLDTFAVNLPSVHVSGDYYDLVRTGPDTIAFVIADAMGHGMPAALMMASVRATLRMGLTLGLPWDVLFRGVDNIIAQARVMSFVTGMVGQIDLAEGEMQLVLAGHQPPSILVDGLPVQVPEDCVTRPWGLDFECGWQVGRIPLGHGDWSVLCYTDGVTEAIVRGQQLFGTRRVESYHHENREQSAEDLCQGLLSVIASSQQSNSLGDDQTVLVLRTKGERGV